ncbi:MAG TPA: thiamine-phosphate kinase [Candidatus Korarchaeota archaeon]|nr:thiamine-phosphate kinase [Candidatus Korarchaeota archaeon]
MEVVREEDVIRRLSSISNAMRGGVLPLGLDDAAALELRGTYVVNVDTVSEGSDLLPGMTLRQLARKIVVQTFSDIAAKGAKPAYFLISLCLPRKARKEDIDEIALGLDCGLSEVGGLLIGGDVDSSQEIIMTGVGIGLCDRQPIPRGGARPGDVIAVTGYFGLTWLGYRVVVGRLSPPKDLREDAIRSVYEPKAAISEGALLGMVSGVHACADSSDGLYKTLHSISLASRVKIVVEELPIEDRLREYLLDMGLDLVEAAFYGGEEFHLVVAVDPKSFPTLASEFKKRGLKLMKIGQVAEGSGVFLRTPAGLVRLREGGWDAVRDELQR